MSSGNLRDLVKKSSVAPVKLKSLTKNTPPGQDVTWGKNVTQQGVLSLQPAWMQKRKAKVQQHPKAICHFIKTPEAEYNIKCEPEHETLIYEPSETSVVGNILNEYKEYLCPPHFSCFGFICSLQLQQSTTHPLYLISRTYSHIVNIDSDSNYCPVKGD